MNTARITLAVTALVLLLGVGKSFTQIIDVDSTIPLYSKVSGVSGNIDSVGSDTMNNLMTLWCQKFNEYYPNVRCQIEGKGSSTAPPARAGTPASTRTFSMSIAGVRRIGVRRPPRGSRRMSRCRWRVGLSTPRRLSTHAWAASLSSSTVMCRIRAW